MSWTHKQVEQLIKAYKINPCLYAPKNTLYHNKQARRQALAYIISELDELRPNTTPDEIKHKIANLRTTYLAEKRKIQSGKKNGIDDIVMSNLWYFNKLSFIDEHVVYRLPKNALDVQENSMSDIEFVLVDTDSGGFKQEEDSILSETEEKGPPVASTSSPNLRDATHKRRSTKRARTLSGDDNFMKTATETLQALSNRAAQASNFEDDEETAFGRLVTARLKHLNEFDKLNTMRKIDDIFHELRINNLKKEP